MLTRRHLGFVVFGSAAPFCAARAGTSDSTVTVYRSPTCGCCKAWVSHIEAARFTTKIVEMDDVSPVKRRAGVPIAHESCHTALIDGYFIEGHVPAGEIQRLLAEKPKAQGISVPGMPVGSPGMEVLGVAADRFQTILIASDGSATVFAKH